MLYEGKYLEFCKAGILHNCTDGTIRKDKVQTTTLRNRIATDARFVRISLFINLKHLKKLKAFTKSKPSGNKKTKSFRRTKIDTYRESSAGPSGIVNHFTTLFSVSLQSNKSST